MTQPNITVRGVRQVVPTGHVVGRRSAGNGQVELIPFADLGSTLTRIGAVSRPTVLHPRLSMNLTGPFTVSQQFTAAPAPVGITFPSTATSVAECDIAPTGSVTFYLLNNVAAFMASGAPAGVLATVTFIGGATSGSITYNGTQTVAQNSSLTLVMPATPNASFSGVRLTFTGDQT